MAYVAPAGNALNYYAIGAYAPPAGDELLFDGQSRGYLPQGSLRGLVRCRFGRSQGRSFSRQSRWLTADSKRSAHRLRWENRAGQDTDCSSSWAQPDTIDRDAFSAWGDPPSLERAEGSSWATGQPRDDGHDSIWQQAGPVETAKGLGFTHATVLDQNFDVEFVDGQWLDVSPWFGWEVPEVVDAFKTLPWGRDYIPRYCWRLERRVYGDSLFWNAPGGYTPPAGNALLFDSSSVGWPVRCIGGTQTGAKDAYWYRPRRWVFPRPYLRRSYLMINTASLKIISSNYDIAVDSLDISIDRDAWCWSLSAGVLKVADLALLRPINGIPIAVEAMVNGFRWCFLIEDIGRSKRFGQSAGTVRGRSLSAALATPYAGGTTAPCAAGTSRQLAEAELANTGWTTVWSAADWTVPAGAISWQNQAPMAIIARIAEACGASVQTHPWDTVLTVAPWWSTPPWQWAAMTVDALIPEALIEQMAWVLEPRGDYNGVWVRGELVGVNALIRRVGTDGADAAPGVVDALLTDIAPATARGTRILADNLTRERVTLTLPLLPNPGLLTPGKVIEVQEATPWRGMVARCGLSVKRPAVWQNIEVFKVG